MKKPGDASPNHLLRKAREGRRWTQENLAEQIGTTGVTVSRWENGIISPGPYYRQKLSELFGKSTQDLGFIYEDKDDTRHELAFPFNEPLANPREFYGRVREKRGLLSRTYRKASTSIVGPRRMGKTWLVSYLRLVAQKELGLHYRVGYLDATGVACSSVDGFAREALSRLGLSSKNRPAGLVGLDAGLQELVANNVVPVLCIDEFEGFSNRETFSLEFFRNLRAMAHTSDLVLIAVSKQPLHLVISKEMETSGFFNIFEQMTLKPFTENEAEQFINDKGGQADFSPAQIAYLWQYGNVGEGQWSPLRLQLTGSILLNEEETFGDDEESRRRFEELFESKLRGVMGT